jgi:isoquinoline 1-oxidoreductase subunit beta
MSDVVNLSRRQFIRASALAGGGLVLGVYVPSSREGAAAKAAGEKPVRVFAPNAFVRIALDGTVTVVVNHSEMGQGVYTALPMIVADELGADWKTVRYKPAPASPVYNHALYGMQMTGGSTSTWTEFDRLRKAGATARAMLVAAAAKEANGDPSGFTVANGVVTHTSSGRRFAFGDLVQLAAEQPVPENVPLKHSKDFTLIGKSTPRLDTPDKTNGKAVFGIDVNVPGMLVAVVARPPVFGGKLKRFDAKRAEAMPGVRHVVEISRGVAVVADGFWAAKKGREALEVEWDDGPLASLDSKTQLAEYAKLAETQGAVARNNGDAVKALAAAATKSEAVYELPYLAHATMEPLNCVADVRADGCEVWTGTQFQTADHAAAVKITGLKPAQVKLHTTLLGGGFGRRAVFDSHFVCEAVETSKAVKKPVKVVWTREDDMRGGYYRPVAYHKIAGGLDAEGKPTAWQQRIVCQSFAVDTPFENAIVVNGVDETAVEGAKDLPYDVPNVLVDWQKAPAAAPVLWWRSVGHTHTAFVVETFMDELAHAAGKDPVEFRLGLLTKNPRYKRVLELVAEKSSWNEPVPEGLGRGIAVHESFGSFVADVVYASLSPEGKPRVHKVVCAIDCGPTVNPQQVRAQMESGIAFGLTAALYGEITLKDGRVQQSNFHDYPILRINEMPAVEVHIVESTDKMGGVGEPGVPPVAPALANALFSLTGKRLRRLPIRVEDLKQG